MELYSKQLAAAGLDPIPQYQSLAPPPEGFLRLLNGRSPYHSFTRTMNNVWLAEMHPVNVVWINDRVAASVGLTDGDPVELENQDAVRTGPVPVKVTPGIRPEVAYLPHGWGQRVPELSTAHEQGASDNRLMTRFAEDPETGATGLRVNYLRLVYQDRILNAPPPEQFGIAPEPKDVAFSPAVSPLSVDEDAVDDSGEIDWEEAEEWEELFPEESC